MLGGRRFQAIDTNYTFREDSQSAHRYCLFTFKTGSEVIGIDPHQGSFEALKSELLTRRIFKSRQLFNEQIDLRQDDLFNF